MYIEFSHYKKRLLLFFFFKFAFLPVNKLSLITKGLFLLMKHTLSYHFTVGCVVSAKDAIIVNSGFLLTALIPKRIQSTQHNLQNHVWLKELLLRTYQRCYHHFIRRHSDVTAHHRYIIICMTIPFEA